MQQLRWIMYLTKYKYGMSNVAIFDLSYLYCIISYLYCIISYAYCIISHLYCIISYLYCIFSYLYCIIFICISPKLSVSSKCNLKPTFTFWGMLNVHNCQAKGIWINNMDSFRVLNSHQLPWFARIVVDLSWPRRSLCFVMPGLFIISLGKMQFLIIYKHRGFIALSTLGLTCSSRITSTCKCHQIHCITEVPKDVRNSKVRNQEKFRRGWSQH